MMPAGPEAAAVRAGGDPFSMSGKLQRVVAARPG
jgi:hypothetical protein